MKQAAGLLALVLLGGCVEDHEEFVNRPGEPEAAAPGATRRETPKRTRLAWTGCGISKKAYMLEAAAAYRKATGVEIIVTGGGATRGIRATAGGQSDIGGSCRHCLPERSDQEKGVVLTQVAWDALVFFTHPGTRVDGITLDQAKAVLRGTITNWRELGGADVAIIPAFRRQTKQGKLSGVGYMTRLMLFDDPTIDYTHNAIFHVSSGPLEDFVEKTPHSFAVTGVSSAKKRLPRVKILRLDGVAPTKENIRSGDYRLFRPLYLVSRGKPAGLAKEFLDWIVGPEGQAVLSRAGTVTLGEGADLKKKFRHWPADTSVIRNY